MQKKTCKISYRELEFSTTVYQNITKAFEHIFLKKYFNICKQKFTSITHVSKLWQYMEILMKLSCPLPISNETRSTLIPVVLFLNSCCSGL
jgi:hypothetical protein